MGCRPGKCIFFVDVRMIERFFIYFRNLIFVKNPMVVRMNGTEQDFVHRINIKEEAAFMICSEIPGIIWCYLPCGG